MLPFEEVSAPSENALPFESAPAKEKPLFSLERFGKEAAGGLSTAADLAATGIGLPVSGIAGLAATALQGPEAGAKTVEKVQDFLNPSSALRKMGIPEEYLTGTKTSHILNTIASAPHEFLSKPLADKYFELTGDKLGAAVMQGTLDIPAYLLGFKAVHGALGKLVPEPTPAEVARQREELGYKPEEQVPPKPTEIPGGTELPFEQMQTPVAPEVREQGFRNPYIMPEEERTRLEQELNPPTEQRVAGQGELFTGERPYQPGEQVGRYAEPPVPSKREGQVTLGTEIPVQSTKYEGIEKEVAQQEINKVGGAAEQSNMSADLFLRPEDMNRAPEMPIPFEKPTTPIGPIEKAPTFRGPKNQRGSVTIEPIWQSINKLKEGTKLIIERWGHRYKGTVISNKFVGGKNTGFFSPKVKLEESLGVNNEAYGPEAKHLIDQEPRLLGRKINIIKDDIKEVFTGPKSQRGGALIPFGKAAEKLASLWEKKRQELVLSRNRLSKLAQENKIPSEMYIRRSKEINQELTKLRDEREHAFEAAYKERHPDYVNAEVETKAVEQERQANQGFDVTPPPKAKVIPMSLRKQLGAVGDLSKIKQSFQKKGPVKTIKDEIDFWLESKSLRPLKDAMQEKYPNLKPEDIKDIAPEGSSRGARAAQFTERTLSKAYIDRQFAQRVQGRGPISDVIKWVVDNQNSINRQVKLRTEQNTKAALGLWRKLKRDAPQELRDLLTKWQEKIGDKPLVREDFKSDRQWEAYQEFRKVDDDLRERVNDARERYDPEHEKLNPIDYLTNHFPSIRRGDWWVYINDSQGKLLHASAYETTKQANKVYEKLKKDMGDKVVVKPPQLKPLSEHDLSSLDAFEETLRALHSGDPIAKAINARYKYLIGRRGFGRTGIFRKGIPGALGFEAGKEGVKNAEKVLEAYISRAETYIGNLERAMIERELQEFSQPEYRKGPEGKPYVMSSIWDNAPIARDWMRDYMLRSKGANIDAIKGVTDAVDALSTAAGYSRGIVPRFLQKTSSLASLFFLGTLRNMAIQPMQPINIFAKLVDLNQLGDKISNPAVAFFEGYAQALTPDTTAIKGREWALRQGWLESALVELIESKLSTFKSDGAHLLGQLVRYGLGKLEYRAVRVPVFHALEYSLRDTIKDDIQRFEAAANMTDTYMVHYDRESGPLVYDKLGRTIGEATRGLKTYSHNAWGQFINYAQITKNEGRLAPLATFMGMQALIGGLRGVFLYGEAAAFIALLNTIPGVNIPSPDELLLKGTKKIKEWGANGTVLDIMTFGGLSTMLHSDLSASIAAPTMPSLLNFVPIKFAYNAVHDAGVYLAKYFQGTATQADQMKAALSLFPAQARGWIEAYYSQDKSFIPNPNQNMTGNFPVPKDTIEQVWRFGAGFRSLDEAKANLIARTAKQIILQDMKQKTDALSAIADRVATGQQITPDLVQQYIKEGGSMSGLMQGIKTRLINRQLDFAGREAKGQGITPQKAHKLEVLKSITDSEIQKDVEKEIMHSQGVIQKQMLEETPLADENVKTKKEGSDRYTTRMRTFPVQKYNMTEDKGKPMFFEPKYREYYLKHRKNWL